MDLINERYRYYFFLVKTNKSMMLGLGLLIFILFFAFLGPYLYPRRPTEITLKDKLLPPLSPGYPLGTDDFGRDLLSRIIHGTRYTLSAAVIVPLVGLIGVFLGGVAGYSGERTDLVMMRIADIMLAFPPLILAMAVSAALGPSLINSALSVGIAYIPSYMRIIRSKVLSIKELEYVQAAKAIGARPWRIFLIHVLPNSISPVIIASMVYAGFGILWTTALSFVGLGAQPPTPELGLMILKGREYILTGQWWIVIFPGVLIAISVAAFNLIGDGLRDILSPKLRIT